MSYQKKRLPPCSCLNAAGLSFSDTDLQVSKIKWKLIFPCFLCILLTINLHPLNIGLIFGGSVISCLLGWVLLQLTKPKDNMERVRMVASAEKRCPIIFMATLGFWTSKVKSKYVRIEGKNMEVVNLWPLQLGQFSEDLFLKYGTKITCTAVVEVENKTLKVMYTVNNLARKYSREEEKDVEVFSFEHLIKLTEAKIYLVGLENKPASKKFSKKLPICIEFTENGHNHLFYIFPRLKMRKEILFNQLVSAQMEDEIDSEGKGNLIKKVIKECRLEGLNEGEEASLEMVNVLINRLGYRVLTEHLISQPLRKILKRKLKRRLGHLFNFGQNCVELVLGPSFPIVKELGKPWYNERGIWAKVVVCETSGEHYIKVKAQVKTNSIAGNISHSSSCSSEAETEHDHHDLTPPDIWYLETSNLCICMDILHYELVLLLNIPPQPSLQVPPLRLWLGLCHPPHVDIHITTGGTKSYLTPILKTFMPVLEAATLKKFKSFLQDKWVFPNMKEFRLSSPS